MNARKAEPKPTVNADAHPEMHMLMFSSVVYNRTLDFFGMTVC
jgi:hypothetical protein